MKVVTSLSELPYQDVIREHHSHIIKEELHRYVTTIQLYIYFINSELCTCRCHSVTILGTTYKVNKCCIMIGTMQILLGTVPQFGLLRDILLYGNEPHVLFVFTEMETIRYNGNLGAYELMPLAHYTCCHQVSIRCFHPFNPIHMSTSIATYIKSKYDLTVYCYY